MDVANYRPISLTCLVVKIFEKIIRDEIMLKCRHLRNENQHGFLPSNRVILKCYTFKKVLCFTLIMILKMMSYILTFLRPLTPLIMTFYLRNSSMNMV